VVYDFVRKLYADPTALRIFGDGSQSKSYIHVDDVLDALLLFGDDWSGFDVFNVGTDEYVTVREIADMVVEQLGLADVTYEFTGGARGWRGDVPIVRFSTDKIRALGWRNRRSTREALLDSIAAGRVEARPGITSSA
jgi:UDP-glucose 4-epimerase